jgi:hypothetical protein
MGIHLNHTNASCWFIRIEVLLRRRKCWEAVTTGTATPESKDTARLAIVANLGDDLIHVIDRTAEPKAIWEELTEQFSGVSVPRKMALKKAQSSFRLSPDDTLDAFLLRAAQLRTELASANILKEDEFVWQFLSAFDGTQFESWAQSVSAQKQIITLADLTENLRGTFYHKMSSSPTAQSSSGAYQSSLNPPSKSKECVYCGKPGHVIFQCFKLKDDQRAYEGRQSQQDDRGRRLNHGRGRGRGRGYHGRGRTGSYANAASTQQHSAVSCTVASHVSSNMPSTNQ